MQDLKTLLEQYKEKFKNEDVPRSERAELVSKFTNRLNADRKAVGMKPYHASFYNMRMADAKLTTQDLYWFYKYCENAKDFSKCWWWSLNAKNAVIAKQR